MYVAGEGATVIEGGGGEEGVWISYGYPQCRSCVANGLMAAAPVTAGALAHRQRHTVTSPHL